MRQEKGKGGGKDELGEEGEGAWRKGWGWWGAEGAEGKGGRDGDDGAEGEMGGMGRG